MNIIGGTKHIYIAFGENTFCSRLKRKTCLEKDPRNQNFGFWTGSLKSLALSPASNASCSQTADKISINLNINGIKWISQKTKRPLWVWNGRGAFSLYATCLNNVLNNVFSEASSVYLRYTDYPLLLKNTFQFVGGWNTADVHRAGVKMFALGTC